MAGQGAQHQHFVELDLLAQRARASEGLVGATILLADEPDRVNSWGNPVQILGFSWAGGYGHPVAEVTGGPVASVSGAVFAVQRSVYWDLGGMDEAYFAYGEDVDLSLRAHLQNRPVEVVAEARAGHHYEFGRNASKMYLLERNRLITVLTTYQARTLIAVAPLLLAPVELDVTQHDWPCDTDSVDAVFTANTLHIMAWREVQALFRGVGRVLRPDGLLIVYGPFRYAGQYTSHSNHAFDDTLRQHDPASGIRDFEAVDALAAAQGLTLVDDVAMPANNQTLVWRRAPA